MLSRFAQRLWDYGTAIVTWAWERLGLRPPLSDVPNDPESIDPPSPRAGLQLVIDASQPSWRRVQAARSRPGFAQGTLESKSVMMQQLVSQSTDSNVFRGKLHSKSLQDVALKRPRWFKDKEEASAAVDDLLREEASQWKKIAHQRILPFLGVWRDSAQVLYLISPWMMNGSLRDYIRINKSCDRPKLLYEIAEALVYLHDLNIAHGHVNPENVLVSDDFHALLCDFRLSQGEKYYSYAPEIFEGEPLSLESDVYAFGMTIYEVLRGEEPYHMYDYQTFLRAVICHSERPEKRPEMSSDGRSYLELDVDPVRSTQPSPKPCQSNKDLPSIPPTELQALPAEPLASPNLHAIISPLPAIPAAHPYPSPPAFHTQLILRLAEISKLRSGNLIARVADLGDTITFDSAASVVPHMRAGNSDICRATLASSQTVIAIKVLRAGDTTDSRELDQLAKRLGREMSIWKTLKHKRITPLLGFAILEIGACLISPWCSNGNAMEYIKKHPSIDRRRLVLQVAEGLVFLHTHDSLIIHADIKACNVLIDGNGEAMLCDFGLSTLLQGSPSGFTTSGRQKGTTRWMAPEQFGEKPLYTVETDVYAFGS
ncbi:hypothetical protein FRB99_001201 [Tulasnella sp. 403]|nr:hypothetical protein FRB99_001201 [Tulasnella sp. 403]